MKLRRKKLNSCKMPMSTKWETTARRKRRRKRKRRRRVETRHNKMTQGRTNLKKRSNLTMLKRKKKRSRKRRKMLLTTVMRARKKINQRKRKTKRRRRKVEMLLAIVTGNKITHTSEYLAVGAQGNGSRLVPQQYRSASNSLKEVSLPARSKNIHSTIIAKESQMPNSRLKKPYLSQIMMI